MKNDICNLMSVIQLQFVLHTGEKKSVALEEFHQCRIRPLHFIFLIRILVGKIRYLQQPRVAENFSSAGKSKNADVRCRFQHKN